MGCLSSTANVKTNEELENELREAIAEQFRNKWSTPRRSSSNRVKDPNEANDTCEINETNEVKEPNQLHKPVKQALQNTSPMTLALSQLNKSADFLDEKSRKERKKSYAILIDVYLTQIKRNSDAFGQWHLPKEIVALCISYFESADGSLILRPNSFIQLDADYQYVFEEIVIGGSSTLSAKQNDSGKAKITILCFGDIILHPYSYIHLNETLKLSSYVGYAIYIESFGNIKMMDNAHIDIDSDNASICIKCNKLIMNTNCTIKAKNGEKIVLVISDKENRNEMENKNKHPGFPGYVNSGIFPLPTIYAESPVEALGNIQT